MKPRIFIGSSTERLEIAYAIQENLEYDATPTVWTQGIFKLSNNSLDSIIEQLDKSDFAVFVFHPDDITQIRDKAFETVRDNLIFELGLFIGRLGKGRVFFLIPRSIDKLHLPTDLLGITPGTYDNLREDGNLLASLGPFCNQIRKSLKEFVLENIEDVQGEPDFIKKIIVERKAGWEYLFAAELLELRLNEINKRYSEIGNETVILRIKNKSGQEFFDWFESSMANFGNFIELFKNCFEDLIKSFGPPGVAGKPIEIKNAVERIILLCRELLNWEFELYAINPPEELKAVRKKLMRCTQLMFLDEINRLHFETKQFIVGAKSGEQNKLTLILNPKFPEEINEAIAEFKQYLKPN
jgi:hypothetical protein